MSKMTRLSEFGTVLEYRSFIGWALNYADMISLSYSSDYSAFCESEKRSFLKESVIRYEYDDRGVLLLYLKIDHITNGLLKAKRSLCDRSWTEDGDFLEDLCLFRNGETVLDTISHERQIYISTEMPEEYNKITGNKQ